ncbi:DUF1254 domain-containing protein [Blastopirellula sp. JC732]|uniref:DUF1254 domain-containing protein n=1 Tax=Blastopirellula sediminis TaxID=2894196 RepID=A0A9X1MPJ7_9BACT|nr:DUF1254 domain-containing protein [Blastopirellula sediminis]MCC9605647.1 DUF1254 domain-containing protein [Blastopirellula sediminis]MCC9631053.1 DUF1254 domain-containing protein [Blastopirellula sediminis]
MLRYLVPLIFVLLVTTSGVPVRAQEAPKAEKPAAAPKAAWKEEYARSVGIAAYTYAFPYYYNAQLRWKWVGETNEKGKSSYAAVNHFFHAKRLTTAKYRDGGSPNNDTLYSIAWVDVSKEPVILSIPDMADRYYAFDFAAFNSDNFAAVGQRTNGSGPGNFAIVGPDFADELPSGVIALPKSPTPWVLVMGRTLVYNPQDVMYVRELQSQYKLTPLSYWGKNNVQIPETRDVWQPPDAANDPLAVWKTIDRAMTENPPPKSQQGLVDLFATLKIGPGQNVAKLDPAYQAGLARAAVDGQKILEKTLLESPDCVVANGWKYPPPSLGRAGDKGEFLVRAAQQSLGGIVASDPADAVFLVASVDADGKQLTGTKKYQLQFPAGKLPPAKAYWSITMYSADANLVENSLERYSITSRSIGKLEKNEPLTITIQNEPLTGAAAKNWLPAPQGNFYLMLRTYTPDAEIVEQTWMPPAITVIPPPEKP